MNLPLFLARKIYSTQKNKEHISRPAINIATAGVAIGIIIMTLSLCVVLGFKQTVKNKVIIIIPMATPAVAMLIAGREICSLFF